MASLLLETWFGSCLFDQIVSNGSALKTFDQCEFKTFSVRRLRIMERSTISLSGPRTLLGEAPTCTSIKFSGGKHKMIKTWR